MRLASIFGGPLQTLVYVLKFFELQTLLGAWAAKVLS